MKLRISLLFLLAVLISSQLLLAQAKDGKSPDQVKAEVLKRGTGEKAKIKVKLRSGPEIRGYVSKAGQESFDVNNKKTGKTISIAYADVVSVHKPGMSTGAKVGIAAGAAAVLIAAALASALASLGP